MNKMTQRFGFAFSGLRVAMGQTSLRIHLFFAACALTAGVLLDLPSTEWCILILAMALVISLEIVNTAIEETVNFISPGHDHRAGRIKDLAAAAVLVAAIASVVIGAVIFLPKII